MIDIRQSPQYASFMTDLGWKVEKVGRWNAFVKYFPLIGSYIKIQKIQPPIPFREIESLKEKYKIIKLQISPDSIESNKKIYNQFLDNKFKIDYSPNIPTRTIHISLTNSEKVLFSNLSSAKRRAVRKGLKNEIIIKQSTDINSFINIRKKQNFPLGFLLIPEMKKLWKHFYPKNAALLIAYNEQKQPLAGILLLFYKKTSYYWYASSTNLGKKLSASSLLVWEAIKLAKEKKFDIFDFEGIYDERFEGATKSWRGFTKFKEGFGGKILTYSGSFYF